MQNISATKFFTKYFWRNGNAVDRGHLLLHTASIRIIVHQVSLSSVSCSEGNLSTIMFMTCTLQKKDVMSSNSCLNSVAAVYLSPTLSLSSCNPLVPLLSIILQEDVRKNCCKNPWSWLSKWLISLCRVQISNGHTNNRTSKLYYWCWMAAQIIFDMFS